MKIFKRLSILSMLVITLLIFTSLPINVFAANSFSNFGATYSVTEVTDERDLGYGVKFHREVSTLTTNISGISTSVSIGVPAKQQVSVLEFGLSEDVQLVPYAFLESSSWVASTVKKAAAQYELKNPGYRVIAAVNGDFFKINDPVKASTGVTIGQGEYYKAISNHGGVNSIAIKNDGVGKQLFTSTVNTSYPFLSIYDEDGNIIKKIQINKVNEEPGAGEISLHYAQRTTNFGNKVNAEKVSNAYYVQIASPAVISIKNSFYGVGNITGFTTDEIELIQGQFAVKSNNDEITQLLNTGVKIRCQYEYTDPSVAGIENFIGFPFTIIENNEAKANDLYRHPRTMIGQKENGEIVLAVVDGRQASKNMNGATCVEMAAIMGYYDCVDAWNLDGGGSSTMIVRKQEGWDFTGTFEDPNSNWHITNSPSDGSERSDGNHLLVVVKLPEIQIDLTDVTVDSITLNVALLTDVEKYKELYVLMNSKFYPVENGKVTFNDLSKNTVYQFEIFAKVDDQMLDFMTVAKFKTSKPAPTSALLRVDLYEKNGEEFILIRYKLDAADAVKTIILLADDNYLTAGESILIEKTQEFYDSFTNAQIKIKYNVNDLFEDQEIILENYEIILSLLYSMDEIESTINNSILDVFN